MREILFRGKQSDTGEWVEGFLLKVTIDGKSAYLIFGDNFCFDGSDVKALSHALVDPSTVCQFTGMRDRNGKRVFEGDVVVFRESKYAVEWVEKYCRFSGRNEGTVFAGFSFDRCEVIGNIHESEPLEVTPHWQPLSETPGEEGGRGDL